MERNEFEMRIIGRAFYYASNNKSQCINFRFLIAVWSNMKMFKSKPVKLPWLMACGLCWC